MRLFFKSKDGGQDPNTTGYRLIEWKSVFSIVLLKFEGASRPVYHSHAFNCLNWMTKGGFIEDFPDKKSRNRWASFMPFMVYRGTVHKVHPMNNEPCWVLSFRGPWSKTWKEISATEEYELTHGRIRN